MEEIKFLRGSIEFTPDAGLREAFRLANEWQAKPAIFIQLFKDGQYDGIIVPQGKLKQLKTLLEAMAENAPGVLQVE